MDVLRVALIQVLITLIAVMTVAPILFRLGEGISPELARIALVEVTGQTMKTIIATFGLLLLLGAIGMARFMVVTFFVFSGMATAATATLLAALSANLKVADLDLWPGFLMVVGFLAIAAALEAVIAYLAAMLATVFDIDVATNRGKFILVLTPLSSVAMFLPAFMYGAWLAPQLANF